MTPVLSVSRLVKDYGAHRAVDEISFEVHRGEIVGLLGPNGAGKTTTINMILGVLSPDAGTILIDGLDASRRRSEALGRTNFAAASVPLPGNLTVGENLRVFGLLYGVGDLSARIADALKLFDLAGFRDTKAGLLSSGEQTRLCLAKALLNRPRLLLLDEPTASLDPATAREIRARIQGFAVEDRAAVLWTSHNMREVEEVCDRVLFLSRGKILLQGSPKSLPAEHGQKTLEDLFVAVARDSALFASRARGEELFGCHGAKVFLLVRQVLRPTGRGETFSLPAGPGAALGGAAGMKAHRVGAVALRQFYLLRGSLSRVVPLFAWVAVDIVLWGFITKYLNGVSSARLNFVPVLLGAVLLWDFFTRVMQGVTMAFFEDVWSRNFLNFFASPLTLPEYLAGLVISSVATSAVGLAVMLLLAASVFGLSFLAYGALFVPFLLVLFLFGVALGILAVALVLRLGPAAEWFVWPIPALIAPFAGVFYPLSVLPLWMRAVARVLPPSYVFEAMRAIISGAPASWADLAWSGALAAVFVAAAGLVFSATYRYGVRSGLLARYSAESVS